MALKSVPARLDDETIFIVEQFGKKQDWKPSQTIRNMLKSYIEEHNLVQMFTSD